MTRAGQHLFFRVSPQSARRTRPAALIGCIVRDEAEPAVLLVRAPVHLSRSQAPAAEWRAQMRMSTPKVVVI